MARRKRYTPQVPKKTGIMVNVTSLTDMFTVILVFLLQTYNTSEVQIEPPKDLRVPTSLSEGVLTQGLEMTLSKDSLLLGKEVVAQIRDGDLAQNSKDSKDPNFIPALFESLEKTSKDSTVKAVKDGQILLIADRELSYAIIKKVMYTASMAGFPQVKLITSSQ
ncbi:MAG: biopolymer transporter ExbD [Bdellovibrionaceae bacterium]|nr:biopolymer transporter ExbD [Pseudobdellovibrionaceae bacterium]